MPRNRNNSEPPPMMTWGRASPVLIVAAIFDAVRFMFTWFIFFGPAIAALYCTAKATNMVGTSALAVKASAAVCGTGAAVAGFFGVEVTGTIGLVMAPIIGFAGWLAVVIILLIFNARIFKENFLTFVVGFLVSEIPFVNSVPAITIAMWRMYSVQIKTEKVAFKKWEKAQAGARLQERKRQIAEMQAHAVQQQAANDEMYDDEEIPEGARQAA